MNCSALHLYVLSNVCMLTETLLSAKATISKIQIGDGTFRITNDTSNINGTEIARIWNCSYLIIFQRFEIPSTSPGCLRYQGLVKFADPKVLDHHLHNRNACYCEVLSEDL